MAKQKLIIVGGGISGLAAGSYALMNDFDAEILEMHSLPGGMCTSWKRKGFVFDYCLHNLSATGSAPKPRRLSRMPLSFNEKGSPAPCPGSTISTW